MSFPFKYAIIWSIQKFKTKQNFNFKPSEF
jgi:hypothetical protein